MSDRPTVATVDLGRIRANFRTLERLVEANAFICPMVKANAYGHGDIEVARELRSAGCRNLGVALVEEGLRLRAAGDQESILIFGPFYGRDGAQELARQRLTPVVSDWVQLEALALNSALRFTVHLEFDTGMHRLGFDWREAEKLRAWLDRHPAVTLEGVCTHLFRGDDLGTNADSDLQMQRFAQVLMAFAGLKFSAHILNSAGAAARHGRTETKGPLGFTGPLGFRPGIALYGQQPAEARELTIEIKPPLALKTEVVSLREIEAGETVSYNGTWRASRRSLVGVCPVGYADGYRRGLSNKGSVLCRGHRVPIAGTVCMDYIMIDLTDVVSRESLQPGEEVVLIGAQLGEEITAHEIAETLGTISYEVLTGISSRVPRRYLNSEGS